MSSSSRLDWLRRLFVGSVLALLLWSVASRYTGVARSEPYRKAAADFFDAVRAGDTVRIRAFVATEQVMDWALAVTRSPSLIPPASGRLEVMGPSAAGEIANALVFARGPCIDYPYRISFERTSRHPRIVSIATACPPK